MIEFPADKIEFSYADGNGGVGRIDVIESRLTIDQFIADNPDAKDLQVVDAYRSWLKAQGYDLSVSQTWTLLHHADKAYEEFKKKLDDLPTLRTDTSLIQHNSTD